MPDLNSDVIASLESGSPADGYQSSSNLREAYASLSITAGDYDSGDVLRLFRVPANARISELVNLTAIAGITAPDVGVYQARTTTAIDADFLATDVDVSSANANLLEALSPENLAKPLKEALNRSNQSEGEYDIAISVDANTTGVTAQTIYFRLRYVI